MGEGEGGEWRGFDKQDGRIKLVNHYSVRS